MIAKIQKFISEVYVELKKVSWSTRKDLIDAAWIVILSAVFLEIFISVMDVALSKILQIIIG
jgi:preprotein translocase subunit SecE